MITLVPAYGRDYKSKTQVLADWNGDKDFVIQNMFHPDDGRYCNKSELPKGTYNIRYKRLTMVCLVKN
jgi:hypothetical protein